MNLTPLEGLVVAWSALVGRDRSKSGSVGGSGRLWSGVGAGDAVPL